MTQLDLFLHRAPSAQVFEFPGDRRVSFAHEVASRLDVLDFESGKTLWRTVCRDLRKRLRRDGMATAAIKTLIDELAADVHEELKTIRIQKQYRPQAMIFSLTGQRINPLLHGDGAGEASAMGQGAKLLAGLGGAHAPLEYDAARACEGTGS